VDTGYTSDVMKVACINSSINLLHTVKTPGLCLAARLWGVLCRKL